MVVLAVTLSLERLDPRYSSIRRATIAAKLRQLSPVNILSIIVEGDSALNNAYLSFSLQTSDLLHLIFRETNIALLLGATWDGDLRFITLPFTVI